MIRQFKFMLKTEDQEVLRIGIGVLAASTLVLVIEERKDPNQEELRSRAAKQIAPNQNRTILRDIPRCNKAVDKEEEVAEDKHIKSKHVAKSIATKMIELQIGQMASCSAKEEGKSGVTRKAMSTKSRRQKDSDACLAVAILILIMIDLCGPELPTVTSSSTLTISNSNRPGSHGHYQEDGVVGVVFGGDQGYERLSTA
ncbi:hypothetical protein BY996DRAFT_6516244 [Phakopsora pachyrhizi]|nr:hypothetical protein BY996DRAFT_6516244 [Phakopsora pachyrhizi]